MTQPTPPKGRPAWASKMPADMTLEELQQAKAGLIQRVSAAAARAQSLSAQLAALDNTIAMRFGMPVDPEVPVPSYDVAAVERELDKPQA